MLFGDDEEVKAEVIAGKMQLWQFNGSLLTVLEKQGNEFVICCAVGQGLAAVLPELYDIGKRLNCQKIRFHTSRKGLVRMSAQYAPKITGLDDNGLFVYEIEVV